MSEVTPGKLSQETVTQHHDVTRAVLPRDEVLSLGNMRCQRKKERKKRREEGRDGKKTERLTDRHSYKETI